MSFRTQQPEFEPHVIIHHLGNLDTSLDFTKPWLSCLLSVVKVQQWIKHFSQSLTQSKGLINVTHHYYVFVQLKIFPLSGANFEKIYYRVVHMTPKISPLINIKISFSINNFSFKM